MRRRSSLIRPGSISVVLCSAFGSRAVCVRRCSHSFQWCLVRLFASIHFISSSSSGCCFFRSFPFIFSFISGTNYFSCFFFFFSLLFRRTSNTHIFHLRFVFFLLRRQQRLFFISIFFFSPYFSLPYIAAHSQCSDENSFFHHIFYIRKTWRRWRRLSLASS